MVATPSPPSPQPRLVAIVPVRTLEGAKSRLGDVLDPEERQELVTGLLERTISALLASSSVAEVVVVSPDRRIRRLAGELGARPLAQERSGLNAGLEEARDDVIAGGATALLVVPGDLPGISPGAIDDLVTAAGYGGAVVAMVPDRHGRGTNALLLRPPDVIGFAFGGDSHIAHQGRARQAGARYVEVDGPLTLDLDTPEDLLTLEATDASAVPR